MSLCELWLSFVRNEMIKSWTKKWFLILFLMASCFGHLVATTGEKYFKMANQALKRGDYHRAVAFYKRSCNLRMGVGCTEFRLYV